jgi:hypothetical protein
MLKTIDQTEIRDVLLRDWDPIGVKDVPEARNEYDAYLAPLAGMLASDKSVQDIGAYLCRIESERMGLTADPRRAETVARKLEAIRSLS